MSRTTFNSVTVRYLLGLSAFLLGVAQASQGENELTVTLKGSGKWELSCYVSNSDELREEDTKWAIDMVEWNKMYKNTLVRFNGGKITRTITLKNDKFESVETPLGFSGTTMRINLQGDATAKKISVNGENQKGNTDLVFELPEGQTEFKIQKKSGGFRTKYKTLTLTFPRRDSVTGAPSGAATTVGYQTKNSHPIIAKWWCDKCNRDFMGNLPAHNNYKHEKSRVPKKCPKCHQDDVIDWDGKDRRRRRRLAPLERLLDAMQ